jgi:hypothetical protein
MGAGEHERKAMTRSRAAGATNKEEGTDHA